MENMEVTTPRPSTLLSIAAKYFIKNGSGTVGHRYEHVLGKLDEQTREAALKSTLNELNIVSEDDPHREAYLIERGILRYILASQKEIAHEITGLKKALNDLLEANKTAGLNPRLLHFLMSALLRYIQIQPDSHDCRSYVSSVEKSLKNLFSDNGDENSPYAQKAMAELCVVKALLEKKEHDNREDSSLVDEAEGFAIRAMRLVTLGERRGIKVDPVLLEFPKKFQANVNLVMSSLPGGRQIQWMN